MQSATPAPSGFLKLLLGGIIFGGLFGAVDGVLLGTVIVAITEEAEPLIVCLWLGLILAVAGCLLGGLCGWFCWFFRTRLVLRKDEESSKFPGKWPRD